MNRTSVLRFLGFLLSTMAIILMLSLNTIVNLVVIKEMAISPGSTFYDAWKDNPVPLSFDIYPFNCTNTDQFNGQNYVPEFEQLGPYRFSMYLRKRNIVWNDNHTVTYEQTRTWYFDAENSNGSLDDTFITLNPVPLTASYISRHWSSIVTFPLSAAIQSLEKSMWATKSVGEMTFDGYTDPMLRVIDRLPNIGVVPFSGDKFGFLYEQNGTSYYDGISNIATGEGDISEKGTLLNWHYKNHTGNYEDHCGDVRGSMGEILPPLQTRESFEVFTGRELCRSVQFDYVDDTEVLGVPGRRYLMNNSVYDNGTSDPDTECYCAGQCLRQGVLNVSSCYFGAPVFSSQPHFMDADPYYRQRVKGMKPDPELHTSFFVIEPITGVTIRTVDHMQINFYLQRNPKITMFRNVPELMFPVVWLRKEWRLNEQLAGHLKLLLALPVVGFYFSIALLVLGLLMLIFTIPVRILYHLKKTLAVKIMRKSSLGTASGTRMRSSSNMELECQPPENDSLLNSKSGNPVSRNQLTNEHVVNY